MIFFIADTHFGQDRTLELSKRPFASLEEMNEHMIFLWNYHIKDGDTVYHLGDFGVPSFVDELNGDIVMIPGNYENARIRKQLEKKGVKFLSKKATITMNKGGETHKIDLVHEPLNATWENFTLFAHVHGQKYKRKGLNVGVDCHHFRPLSVDDMLFFKEAVEEHYDENVFCE
jgi:calcineurin-like phosphoesterase family protein